MKLVIFLAAALAAAACLGSSAWAGTILRTGSQGAPVATLQQYLHANVHADFYAGNIDSAFGPMTRAGLIRWQKTEDYRPTGAVAIGSSQWVRLQREAVVTRLAGYISQPAINAARQTGWAVDASKSPAIVSVLQKTPNGTIQVALSISAAYGGYKADDGVVHNTDDGVFHIFAEHGPDYTAHVPGKPWNGAPMPYAACFNGGDCLHYDGLFPSHGCIHIPSMTAAMYIDRLPMGTTVVVHG